MAIKQYRRLQVKDKDLQLVQDAVEQSLRTLTDIAFIDGRLIEDEELASGDNIIDHKLNRNLRGYIIVKTTASIDVYDKQTTNATPTKTLVLNSSAAATASIWVF